ncbi:UNVERIFIED_CONTAM: Retrovirus-related Pol polyprotein from transposon TNT 1-94 [Sesamum radiatum]|uniref:Retrovirus-related Pol polyprotein from transposon TNT 1-94 n=1 Tax=Sesamum radiatum TaxID=300843 RepID=A0AAW2L3S1_SESRA
MEHSKRGLIPMRHGNKLSKKQSPKTDEELKRMSNIPYASAVGSIQLSDASFQSDDDDAKSQSDFVFKLNGGVVAWKSSKKDTTIDSTTEAEYIVASEAVNEAVWMKNYIQELGVVPSIAKPVVIFCDNHGIAQATEPRSYHHSKHILRRYHLLREIVSRGDCRMDRVSSAENTTDPLTKPMSQIAHTQHLDKMGLRSMGDWLLVKWEIVRIGVSPTELTRGGRHMEDLEAWNSCGHSRCPNRIGGSYVERFGTQRSQVISIDAWSKMRTDAQFHALDQGQETVDGRIVRVRTRNLNVHVIIHPVSISHGPLLDGHPW